MNAATADGHRRRAVNLTARRLPPLPFLPDLLYL